MPDLIDVPVTRIQLELRPAPSPKARVEQLRGAIAAAFPDDDLFHQHRPREEDSSGPHHDGDGNGRDFVYRYPRIQYALYRGHGQLTGILGAAERLAAVPWLDLALRLGPDAHEIADARIELQRVPVGISGRLLRYRFATPWMFLNQKNHSRFDGLSPTEQRAEMDRILVGNLLAALGGFDHRVPREVTVYAAFELERFRPRQYKGVNFRTATGRFVTNVALPDGVGLGKGPSHGHGSLARV